MARGKGANSDQPHIVNRRARHDYHIEETLEVGLKLAGSEVKSVRDGKVSLAEGYVRAQESPPGLYLHNAHIAEYPPAGARQHEPTRTRRLLAHRREIVKLASHAKEKGVTIVPLRLYFKNGRAKLEIGVGRGKGRTDKRQDLRKREARREIDRAMSRKMRAE